MVNYYYDDKAGEDTLIVDIHQKMFVVVRDYSERAAEDPEDYNYRDAEYILIKKKYPEDGVLLNDNEMFLETLEQDGENLQRNVIKTVLQ